LEPVDVVFGRSGAKLKEIRYGLSPAIKKSPRSDAQKRGDVGGALAICASAAAKTCQSDGYWRSSASTP
jgi:hypothetical protein